MIRYRLVQRVWVHGAIIRIDNRQQYFFPVCIRQVVVRFHVVINVINVISLSVLFA